MQSSIKTERGAKPLGAIILIVVGLYTLLSLVTYSESDPSWNFSSSDVDKIHNWGGLVGSWFADSLLQIFGIVAYLLTLGSILAGVQLLRSKTILISELARKNQKPHWAIPTAIAIMALCLSGLLSMIPVEIYHELSLGGVLGFLLAKASVWAFSSVGAVIILMGALWAGLFLLTDRIWVDQVLKLPMGDWMKTLQASIAEWRGETLDALKSIKSLKKSGPQVHQIKVDAVKSSAQATKSPEGAPLQKKLEDLFKKRSEEKSSHAVDAKTGEVLEARSLREEPVEFESKGASRTEPKVVVPREIPHKKRSTEKRELGKFELPSLQLLDLPQETGFEISKEELIANSRALEQKLLDFGVQGHVSNIRPGPIITLYEFEPAAGVKVKNILNLTDDLKLAMKSTSIRILAPIPGKAAVGIEIPNPRRQPVYLREILQSALFQNSQSPLIMGMGKSTSGEPYVADLAKMPHLLIAGATGSGKSVGLNAMIVSMLFKTAPEDLKFIMIDPKMLELSVYDGIPHLLLPVVTDPKKAARALAWAVKEMERRYKLISSLGARNLKSYNEKVEKLSAEELRQELQRAAESEATTSAIFQDAEEEAQKALQDAALQEAGLDHYVKLPNIVVVIDELADLIMVAAREVEESIARLAQMARAAGIHLMIATQRPSVDVITGVIKANLPTRCAFQVASKVDSRTIIDSIGAENLIGEGDMLFLPPGTSRLERLHGPFISEDEIARVVRHLKSQAAADYSTEINLEDPEARDLDDGMDGDIDDELYDQALTVVFETKAPSASMLQRRLRIGYNRAARLIERMEREGIVSAPQAGGKGRELLVTPSYES